MSNQIYSECFKGDYHYPPEALRRIHTFLGIFKEFVPVGSGIEIGTGPGYIKNKLIEKGYDILGTDLYPSIPGVVYLDFHTSHLSGFDFLISSHVLEHIQGGVEYVLGKALKFVKDGGMIFCAVPNGERDNKHQPFNEDIGHYTVFRKDDVLKLYPNAEVIEVNDDGFSELIIILRKNS